MEKLNTQNTNIREVRKGCVDNFHAFMVDGAEYDGFYDIPFIPQPTIILPAKLISYDKISNLKLTEGDFIHFYIDDQKFDGPKGIWNGINSNQNYSRGFKLQKFSGATGIIGPDFSLYMDMPRVMQIWNTYRNRAISYYLTKLGYYVIPNIRWTDEESYDFAFSGIYEGSIVSVGTLGCAKEKNDKILFLKGFVEMLLRIKPSKVIIYGSIFKELRKIIEKFKVDYLHFESETSKAFRGDYHGNEI